jgi:hypothetical protein
MGARDFTPVYVLKSINPHPEPAGEGIAFIDPIC